MEHQAERPDRGNRCWSSVSPTVHIEGSSSAFLAVGDANPLHAMENALRTFGADEIIISTHPEGGPTPSVQLAAHPWPVDEARTHTAIWFRSCLARLAKRRVRPGSWSRRRRL